MLLLLACAFFLAGYAVLILFYFHQWKKTPEYQPALPADVFVSVVIAARNEETTLPLLLQDLGAQDYTLSKFEVIVVNDFSTDGTASLAAGLPLHFRMIEPACKPDQSSKKKAIATGVAEAKGKLIMVTDADCRVGKKWVSTMASFYRDTGASFIAAPVKYSYRPSLLQALQVLDFITLQGITAASVASRFHTMCNGANLAYPKRIFEKVNGFAGIDKIPTGDDMLLMHKIWKQGPEKVFYLKSKEAIVSTAPMQTWREFFNQRRRWASKTLVYDDRRILAVLGLVLLLNLLPLVLAIAGVFQPVFFLYLLLFLLVKAIIEWPFVFSVAKFYNQEKLMCYFLFLQPLHVFYTFFVGIWSQLGTYNWKGRAHPVSSSGGARV